MLIVLSPAKKLLAKPGALVQETSTPELLPKASVLIKLMKTKSMEEIAALMDLSKDLAELNYQRYQQFKLEHCPSSLSYPALFLFQGDVYQGLQAATWDQVTIDYSQSHLCILSGLYGLLRPLDRIQAYRLEMGSRLANPSGANLYDFWKESITSSLNQQLKAQENPILINLASSEYFKAIDEKRLAYPIVSISFYEKKGDQLKIVGIHAKKARGVMAKFIMQNQIDAVDGLKSFTELGYKFHKLGSNEHQINFVR